MTPATLGTGLRILATQFNDDDLGGAGGNAGGTASSGPANPLTWDATATSYLTWDATATDYLTWS